MLAFLLAPLATPLVFLLVGIIQPGRTNTLAMAPDYIAVYGPFAYAAALTFGLLAYALRPRDWDAWPYYFVIGGGSIGLITAGVLYLFAGVRWAGPGLFGLSSLAGAVSGLCFWLIGICRIQDDHRKLESQRG